jgi:hypothetical protein
MRVLTVSFLILAMCSRGSVAGQDVVPPQQGAAQTGISAAEVIDKYIAATGGIEARRALTSMQSEGRFGVQGFDTKFRFGGLGDFHFYYKAPNNDAFELEHAQRGLHGYTWFGHNKGEMFLRQTVASNWAINGVTVASLDEAWVALSEWDFNKRYSQIKLVGRSDVGGKPAYALLFTPREGDPQIRYFDTETFLLVRMDQVGRFRPKKDAPETRTKIESYYSDYAETSGIRFPHLIRAIGNPSVPKDQISFAVFDLKVNNTIDDAIFKKE